MLEKREFEKNIFLYRMAATVTVVAGLFSLVVFLLLLMNYAQVKAADPINDLTLTELREQYAAAPERDEALAQRIRELDLLTRKAFFTSQTHLRIGGMLLLAGVVVFLVAFKNMARWKPAPPELDETPAADEDWQAHVNSRQYVAYVGVGILAAGLLAAFMTESVLQSSEATVEEQVAEAPAEDTPEPAPEAVVFPTWEEMQLQWPSFRGPGGFGVAHFTNAPVTWDVESGTGIRWKAAVPKVSSNSPVIWGDRLFMSGADETTREIYCYDTESGDLLWTTALTPFDGTPAEPPKVTEDTGYSAPTMAVHGDRAFAIFANGDVAAVDFDGQILWGRNLGVPDNHYGHASSLIAYGGLLLVQYDQNKNSKLLALDALTGETAWSVDREMISWSSPIIAPTARGPQLILNCEKNVDAYVPGTGDLIWSVECLGGEVAPSPAYAKDMVFVANEFADASALQVGEQETKLLWQYDDMLPEVSSPVADGERFYIATSMGDIVALDAASGEVQWEQMYDEGFYSSPVLVGGRIYVFDMTGMAQIVRAGSTYEVIGTPAMGTPVFATPAYMDGRIYVRTGEHLYCIEASNG